LLAALPHTEHELRRLKVLIEDTDSFVLCFVLHRDDREQRVWASELKKRLSRPVEELSLTTRELNPVKLLAELPNEPRKVIFFKFLGSTQAENELSDFDKFAGYANIQREAFETIPHAAVFWLREELLVRLMKQAPDFWAWRSGVFDVRGEVEQKAFDRELEELSAYDKELLEEQVALYRDILRTQQQQPEPDLEYIVRTQLRLFDALEKLGHFGESLNLANQTLTVAEKLGNEGLQADALGQVGTAQRHLGDFEKSRETLQTHLKMRLGLDNQHSIAFALNQLALTLHDMGEDEEAQHLYRETMRIYEKTLGKAHPSYATGLNNLANLLRHQGRYEGVEHLYREALAIDEKTLGKMHPKYAIHLSNLANLLKDQGRYEEAEPLCQEAMTIFEKTLGKTHPKYAVNLTNMANLFTSQGRYDKAELLYREALDILHKRVGDNHPHTKIVAENYKFLLRELQEKSSKSQD
jgi:tetratricopeptide (TPR) repeat protein